MPLKDAARAAPAAQTIACLRCGGIVPLRALTPRVRCPYCGHDQDVPPQKLAQLAQYQRSAGDLVARIEGEQGQRAQWERWYGPDGKARGGYLGSFLIFGSMVAVYVVAMLLLRARLIDDATLERVLPGAILGVFFLTFGGYVALNVSRGKRGRASAPQVRAQCPRCGAPLTFEAGKVAERCVHCGSPLVAGTTIMHQAIDLAHADLRRAAMARYRLERTAMATVYRSSAANVMPYIVLGLFLPMTAGGAVAFTVQLLTGDGSGTPLVGLLTIWSMALVNGGARAFIVQWRRLRRRRWRAIADASASRLGGRVSTTMGEWVAWLNTFWAGRTPSRACSRGPASHAVTGGLDAFAVAVDLDPVPATSGLGGPRADVLVAARLPGDVEVVAVPADIRHRAHALGSSPLRAREASWRSAARRCRR